MMVDDDLDLLACLPQNSSALQVAVENTVSEMLPLHDSESSPPPCYPRHTLFAFHAHILKRSKISKLCSIGLHECKCTSI